ncbi:TPA: alpha/beta hydrolase, partial [Streptococcus equi subsp. equi]|nr:alpha/beta hydrolase [Streptococcus equi subsp. equi]
MSIIVILLILAIAVLVIEYGQKRSFSSWLLEKMFDYRKYKLSKKADDYEGIETQRRRRIPYHLDNPEAVLGIPTTEYTIDGMQVFVINDQDSQDQPVIYYL